MLQIACPFVYPHWRREQDRQREEARRKELESTRPYVLQVPAERNVEPKELGAWPYLFTVFLAVSFLIALWDVCGSEPSKDKLKGVKKNED